MRQYLPSLSKINFNLSGFPSLFISSTPEETFALGLDLAILLEKGSIVALTGPLGAGKTCLVKGIARGLCIEEEVTSPSYTIISEYKGIIPEKSKSQSGNSVLLYHIDAYRLGGNDDFSAIGGEEIVFGDGISVIEWSERIPAFVPDEALRIDIMIQEDQKRHIRIFKDCK